MKIFATLTLQGHAWLNSKLLASEEKGARDILSQSEISPRALKFETVCRLK